jgi:hypothetical protein
VRIFDQGAFGCWIDLFEKGLAAVSYKHQILRENEVGRARSLILSRKNGRANPCLNHQPRKEASHRYNHEKSTIDTECHFRRVVKDGEVTRLGRTLRSIGNEPRPRGTLGSLQGNPYRFSRFEVIFITFLKSGIRLSRFRASSDMAFSITASPPTLTARPSMLRACLVRPVFA